MVNTQIITNPNINYFNRIHKPKIFSNFRKSNNEIFTNQLLIAFLRTQYKKNHTIDNRVLVV